MRDRPSTLVQLGVVPDWPGIAVTYFQVPGRRVTLRMQDCQICQIAIERDVDLSQKITAAQAHDILKTAKLDERGAQVLQNLAAAIEEVRRRWVVATAIEEAFEKVRKEHRRDVEAITRVRRYLNRKIERWQRNAAGNNGGGALHEGALREALALAMLNRVVVEPAPRIEKPWHDAAIRLARIYVSYADRNAASSWYRDGPAVSFVAAALEVIGCGNLDLDTISKVITRADL